MKHYVLLLRGINVGGKNKLPMADLRKCLEDLGYANVQTFIASGNAIVGSTKPPATIQTEIETILPKQFQLDSELIKVLVLSQSELTAIIEDRPKGFGDQSDIYHYDVIFLMNVAVKAAMAVFSPREGVDTVWPGRGVIYSQRLSAERTKSRLNKIVGTLAYKSMTIRTWNTTSTLLELLEAKTQNH